MPRPLVKVRIISQLQKCLCFSKTVRVDGERWDWGVEDREERRNMAGGEFHFCKIAQHLSPAAPSQASWSFTDQFIQQCLPSGSEH